MWNHLRYLLAKEPDQRLLENTLSLLDHRGPDEAGVYSDSKVGLIHSRLSIIDHSGGETAFYDW